MNIHKTISSFHPGFSVPLWSRLSSQEPAGAEVPPGVLLDARTPRSALSEGLFLRARRRGQRQGARLDRLDHQGDKLHPGLTCTRRSVADGRFCAFATQYGILDGGRVEIWDRKEKKLTELPSIQESPKIHQMHASLTGDGQAGRLHRLGPSRQQPALGNLPLRHDHQEDHRSAQAEPRYVRPAHAGPERRRQMARLRLQRTRRRRRHGRLSLRPPREEDHRSSGDELERTSTCNRPWAATADSSPSSDRPGGAGGRDIYLYDRVDKNPCRSPASTPPLRNNPHLSPPMAATSPSSPNAWPAPATATSISTTAPRRNSSPPPASTTRKTTSILASSS